MEELIGLDTLVLLHSQVRHPVFFLSLRKSCIHLLSEILQFWHPTVLLLPNGFSEFLINIAGMVSEDHEELYL